MAERLDRRAGDVTLHELEQGDVAAAGALRAPERQVEAVPGLALERPVWSCHGLETWLLLRLRSCMRTALPSVWSCRRILYKPAFAFLSSLKYSYCCLYILDST